MQKKVVHGEQKGVQKNFATLASIVGKGTKTKRRVWIHLVSNTSRN
jgi:hypothetical protein